MSESELRQFHVHVRDASHRGLLFEEASFEAAAIAFTERWMHDDWSEWVVFVVRDVETGHECSFRVEFAPDGQSPGAIQGAPPLG
ncbi:MAG TPA: DUF5961 family protein [Caulobacteraceae bacterium]